MKQSMKEMSCYQLRKLAAELGADETRLYGFSKQALIVVINRLKMEQTGK